MASAFLSFGLVNYRVDKTAHSASLISHDVLLLLMWLAGWQAGSVTHGLNARALPEVHPVLYQ